MKKYPKIVGVCSYCEDDIIARNGSFDKPNRKFCSVSCKTSWQNKNIPQSERTRRLSAQRAKETFTGRKWPLHRRQKLSAAISGERHWNWQGGRTDSHHSERGNYKIRYWRRLVIDRDNRTCQNCGTTEGLIDAHHVKSFMKYPELRYQVSNGITLCRSCHAAADAPQRRSHAR